MSKARLEAFTDGVMAILITIMVLDLGTPRGTTLDALRPMSSVFLAYVLSFVILGIYWNNHHHMLHATSRVNGRVLWANLHLLFWLSLVPFVTRWLGQTASARTPTAIYGAVLLLAAIAYTILVRTILAQDGPHSALAAAVGRDVKGLLSLALYALAIPLAFVRTWIADAIYVAVALVWLCPDPRIESRIPR
jgi:uncharacterized membrane protein